MGVDFPSRKYAGQSTRSTAAESTTPQSALQARAEALRGTQWEGAVKFSFLRLTGELPGLKVNFAGEEGGPLTYTFSRDLHQARVDHVLGSSKAPQRVIDLVADLIEGVETLAFGKTPSPRTFTFDDIAADGSASGRILMQDRSGATREVEFTNHRAQGDSFSMDVKIGEKMTLRYELTTQQPSQEHPAGSWDD